MPRSRHYRTRRYRTRRIPINKGLSHFTAVVLDRGCFAWSSVLFLCRTPGFTVHEYRWHQRFTKTGNTGILLHVIWFRLDESHSCTIDQFVWTIWSLQQWLLIRKVTMTSTAIALYGQCCRRHAVGQQVVNGVSIVSMFKYSKPVFWI